MDASSARMDASEVQHVLGQVREGPDMTVGDVCEGCSDPEAGIWVPASFCSAAKADMDAFYDGINRVDVPSLVSRYLVKRYEGEI